MKHIEILRSFYLLLDPGLVRVEGRAGRRGGGAGHRRQGVGGPSCQQVARQGGHGVQAGPRHREGEGEGVAAQLLCSNTLSGDHFRLVSLSHLLQDRLGLPPGAVLVVRVLLHVQRPAIVYPGNNGAVRWSG